MKYLTLIYYDTFARFFSSIENAVKQQNPTAEFLHLAIFPSGFLYMRAQGSKVKLLPWDLKTAPDSTIIASDTELDRITKYHSVVGTKYGERYKATLRERARKYINLWTSLVKDYDPDIVIFSGDTRIAAESLQYCLDRMEHRAKRYYVEQGPNGTTILDDRGVNANCSFREKATLLTGEGYTPEKIVKSKRFKRNPVYRGVDVALIAILRLLSKVPPEWDTISLKKYPSHAYQSCIEHGSSNSTALAKEILIALQVPDDANNIHHNPLNIGDSALLTMVLEATSKTELPVRVREHPLYRRRYTNKLYEQLKNSNRALLSNSTLEHDLEKAAVVITINSMTGLDAYLKNIPVVVLGNSFYDHLPGIERSSDATSLNSIISRLITTGMSSSLDNFDPARIFTEMRIRYFIPGHYLDENLSIPATAIASILVSKNNLGKAL